ncbi:MAG: gliding motility-associated C-terminal domain-containing protein [Bacteroidetes bacterium]|nr:gliding motility-associated C-terminal domain-containing protein [Bacteroidota bacterium]
MSNKGAIKFLQYVQVLLIISIRLNAQGGMWSFMSGDTGTTANAIFGTKGTPSSQNKPPGTYEACEWTDHNGNFWLYGGAMNGGGVSGDLWRFTPSTNEWTWVHGSGAANAVPVYGTKGSPSPNNTPGARCLGIMTWVDKNGDDLWLFGGSTPSSGVMNDLWRFTISTGQWTWMSGSNGGGSAGVYGIKGIPSSSNYPGARCENNATWVDSIGNLWLFGGADFNFDYYNDVWKFNPSSNEWTWMWGMPAATNNSPFHAGKGVMGTQNDPGGRSVYAKFINKNELYILGSMHASGSFRNDMWKFNIDSLQWTFVNGVITKNDTGSMGAYCTYDSSNLPCAKLENRACWNDAPCGFFVFGGSLVKPGSVGYYNDLWRYDIYNDEWAIVSGTQHTSQIHSIGTPGIASIANHPASRSGANAFFGKDGNLWMYGGATIFPNGTWYTIKYTNDLWKFTFDTTCVQICNAVFDSINTDSTITIIPEQHLIIPNVFTPNGDGINDVFKVSMNGYENYSIQIYNRWGEIVFETIDILKHWNGNKNNDGDTMADGTYYYIISVINSLRSENEVHKGFITLLK